MTTQSHSTPGAGSQCKHLQELPTSADTHTPTLPALPPSQPGPLALACAGPNLTFYFFFSTTPFTTLTLQVRHRDWDSWNLPHAFAVWCALVVLSRSLYLCSSCPCPSASLHLSKSDPPSQTWYKAALLCELQPPSPTPAELTPFPLCFALLSTHSSPVLTVLFYN